MILASGQWRDNTPEESVASSQESLTSEHTIRCRHTAHYGVQEEDILRHHQKFT